MPLSEADSQTLRESADKVTRLTAELAQAKKDRDDAIRFALEMGAYPTEICRLTTLTRGRVYQIKGGL